MQNNVTTAWLHSWCWKHLWWDMHLPFWSGQKSNIKSRSSPSHQHLSGPLTQESQEQICAISCSKYTKGCILKRHFELKSEAAKCSVVLFVKTLTSLWTLNTSSFYWLILPTVNSLVLWNSKDAPKDMNLFIGAWGILGHRFANLTRLWNLETFGKKWCGRPNSL